MMTSLSPISWLLIESYGISAFTTTFCVLVFHIAYIPFNFPANYLFDKFGLVIPTLIAVFLYVAGTWVRLLSHDVSDKFYWIVIGQTLAAIG